MIVLFTDFGTQGPYVGEMRAVLAQQAPGETVIDLMHDAPTFDPRASAYLLAALASRFPAGTIFVCVVDPGVGSDRRPVVVSADDRRFVGPDNGLFEIVARRAAVTDTQAIDWRPPDLSASFHGRDLFSPVAARLATGRDVALSQVQPHSTPYDDWPDDLPEIVYIDGYGNAMTGCRAASIPGDADLAVAGRTFSRARTFSDAPRGTAFWYENSSGLAELAVNQGRAGDRRGIAIGAAVEIVPRR